MGQALKKYDDEELAMRERLMHDFPFYAENVLKIRPKEGGLVPFKFNKLQLELHRIIEKQRKETGRVRIIIVKGRQGGCSTYVEGRFYHKTTHQIGKKAFILTHLGEATANLYAMVNRYYDNTPASIRPHKGISNAKELVFDKLDSGYRVSTAGAAGTGRSDTVHYFHGSEVAFWEKADLHAAGVLQAISDAEDTEVILESTANGMNGWFRQQWVDAVAGKSDFIPVFFAWFIEGKYRKKIPTGFALTPEEEEYKALYDLDDEQMCWKRAKEVELGSVELFKQEYPGNAEEAFQFSPVASHISIESVLAAMKRPQYRSYGAIVAGFDPAFKKDGDRMAFVYRQGANVWGLEYPKLDGFRAKLGYLKSKLDDNNIVIDRLFIDFGGGGCDLYSSLDEDGYTDRVRLVNSASAAEDPIKYANRRAEMTDRIKKGLENEDMPWAIDVEKKYQPALQADLTAEGSAPDGSNRLLIEKKDKVKARLGISPDGKDAVGLTVADRVIRKHVMGQRKTAQANNGRANVRKSLRRR
jgi:hypothetical protein